MPAMPEAGIAGIACVLDRRNQEKLQACLKCLVSVVKESRVANRRFLSDPEPCLAKQL